MIQDPELIAMFEAVLTNIRLGDRALVAHWAQRLADVASRPECGGSAVQDDGATADMPRLIPLSHMARRLGVLVGWLKCEAEEGRLPHVRAGRAMLFNVEVVNRILLERASTENIHDT